MQLQASELHANIGASVRLPISGLPGTSPTVLNSLAVFQVLELERLGYHVGSRGLALVAAAITQLIL
jgi:hypothetical protein